MLRRVVTQLPRSCTVLCSRAGSDSARPLPPPSPVVNTMEYIEPKWVTEEHMPPHYRSAYTPSKRTYFLANLAGTLFWTWVLLGFWYDPESVTGHWPWPDSSQWTDKELGIPENLDVE